MGYIDMAKSSSLGHLVFDGNEITKGYLRIVNDTVVEVCDGERPRGCPKGLILPGFVNAHTHIGDSFAYPAPRKPVKELVAPPRGYKHRLLESASKETKAAGMRQSLEIMGDCGAALFSDFREEGIEGLTMLRGLLRPEHPRAVLLGRPVSEGVRSDEAEKILDASEGIGMSSVSDCPMDYLERLASLTRSRGRLFSIHFSEAHREDVDQVLSLRPDFVIHATSATSEDLESLASAKVPIVVCPRSNEFFGGLVNIPAMLAAGITIGLGTDNGMICRPDMFEEIRAAFRIASSRGRVSPLDVIRAATIEGRKILRADSNTTPAAQSDGDFVVVSVPGKDPLEELVTTAHASDVLAVVRRGKVRRPANWR